MSGGGGYTGVTVKLDPDTMWPFFLSALLMLGSPIVGFASDSSLEKNIAIGGACIGFVIFVVWEAMFHEARMRRRDATAVSLARAMRHPEGFNKGLEAEGWEAPKPPGRD